jgi:hypothetical protein
VLSVPTNTLFRKKATLASEPSPYVAVAVMLTAAGAVNNAPAEGAVIEHEGGTLFNTVTPTAADVVVAPWSSVATAVIELEPKTAVQVAA